MQCQYFFTTNGFLQTALGEPDLYPQKFSEPILSPNNAKSNKTKAVPVWTRVWAPVWTVAERQVLLSGSVCVKIKEMSTDKFIVNGKSFGSRLIIGTGKYRTHEEMKAAHKASGAEMVTVAVNRVPLDRKTESFLDHLDPEMMILPNTAGCYDADHAIRTARLAREALDTEWIKLEVIGDPVTLLPDNEQTLAAAKVLAAEGFAVLPYISDDLIVAKKLLDAGCVGVMPLAAPIGSGMGIQNPANIRIMREQLPDAVIIVDAGVGVPSDAAVAMELGADAILMNTAIAEASDAAKMAEAMNYAVRAGRLAYLAGRMPKRLYASASSPIAGAIK